MYFSVSIEMTAAAVGVSLSEVDGLIPPFQFGTSGHDPDGIGRSGSQMVEGQLPGHRYDGCCINNRRCLSKHFQFTYVRADFIFIFDIQAIYSHRHPHQVL